MATGSQKFRLNAEDIWSAIRHTAVPFVVLVAQEVYQTGGEVPNITTESAVAFAAGIVRLAWRFFKNSKKS